MTLRALAAGLAAAALTTAPVFAGSWIDARGDGSVWMYQKDDGTGMSGEWLFDGTTWYYFDGNGRMVTGKSFINGKYEVFDENGAWLYTGFDPAGGAAGRGPGVTQVQEEVPPEPEKTAEDLEAEATAAQVLASIVNDSMTKQQKAAAIYRWMRGSMTYTNNGMYPQDYTESFAALYGFRTHRGNCYVYYSMSKILLSLCGMPSERVVRASDGNHFWNLVDLDGVYYHFDACPRRIPGDWCLVTTGYLMQHSWKAHNFDVAAHPATPLKI